MSAPADTFALVLGPGRARHLPGLAAAHAGLDNGDITAAAELLLRDPGDERVCALRQGVCAHVLGLACEHAALVDDRVAQLGLARRNFVTGAPLRACEHGTIRDALRRCGAVLDAAGARAERDRAAGRQPSAGAELTVALHELAREHACMTAAMLLRGGGHHHLQGALGDARWYRLRRCVAAKAKVSSRTNAATDLTMRAVNAGALARMLDSEATIAAFCAAVLAQAGGR